MDVYDPTCKSSGYVTGTMDVYDHTCKSSGYTYTRYVDVYKPTC